VLSDGSLLVADFGSHCVVKFSEADAKGKVIAGTAGKMLPSVDYMKDIDKPGPVGPVEGAGFLLKRPVAIGMSEGDLLVLDVEACELQSFALSASFNSGKATRMIPPETAPPQRSVNNPESVKYPRAFLRCPDGAHVVCDTWSHRVLKFPPGEATPEVLAGKPNSAGSGAEQLSFPSSVAFGPDGSLYVADTNNHRVQRFPPGSSALTAGETVAGSQSGEAGSGLGQLNMPTGICFEQDGSLLVADRANARLLRYSAAKAGNGAFEALPQVVAGAEMLERPWGVDVAGGFIFVSDERQGVVFKLEGSSFSEKPASAPAPSPPVGGSERAVEEAPAEAKAAPRAAARCEISDDPLQLD